MKHISWILLLLIHGTIAASDWPQWRGPQTNGTPGASVVGVEFKTGAINWQERSQSLSWLAGDGRPYIRESNSLWCYAVKAPG